MSTLARYAKNLDFVCDSVRKYGRVIPTEVTLAMAENLPTPFTDHQLAESFIDEPVDRGYQSISCWGMFNAS